MKALIRPRLPRRGLGVVLLAAVLSAGGAAAAAITSGATDGRPTRTVSVDETIQLTVRYSEFSPSEINVRPGATVRFVVTNLDPIPHELIIGDAGVHERHATGTDAHHGDQPGEVSVAPNSTAETTFTFALQPGPVEFGCHLPGHWSYGMHGVLTVV